MVILAFIEERTAARAILEHLGLAAAPQPPEKARAPPEAAWDFWGTEASSRGRLGGV